MSSFPVPSAEKKFNKNVDTNEKFVTKKILPQIDDFDMLYM